MRIIVQALLEHDPHLVDVFVRRFCPARWAPGNTTLPGFRA
jgi:hypothetical protein